MTRAAAAGAGDELPGPRAGRPGGHDLHRVPAALPRHGLQGRSAWRGGGRRGWAAWRRLLDGVQLWHASLGTFAFDEALDPGGGSRPRCCAARSALPPHHRARGLCRRVAGLHRRAGEHVLHRGVQRRAQRPWRDRAPLDTRRRLDELLSGKRLGHQAAPHIQIHLARRAISTARSRSASTASGARPRDRVPRSWVPKINSQHAAWVPRPSTATSSALRRQRGQARRCRFPSTRRSSSRPHPKGLRGLSGSLVRAGLTAISRRAASFPLALRVERPQGLGCAVASWEFERTEACACCCNPPQGSDADHDHSSAIRAKVERFARARAAPMASLPRVRVVGARLATEPRLYAAADAFVLPSRGTPPCPCLRSPLQARFRGRRVCVGQGRRWVGHWAMSMGVPVIATNWSGHTLFVNDTAWLCRWPARHASACRRGRALRPAPLGRIRRGAAQHHAAPCGGRGCRTLRRRRGRRGAAAGASALLPGGGGADDAALPQCRPRRSRNGGRGRHDAR